MRNNSVCFEFELVVQEETSFKDISYLEVWRPIYWVKWNRLYNFCRRHHEEYL